MRVCPFRSPERIPEKLVPDRYGNAIEGGELVRRAVAHAFGARAVVTTNINDQRVVEFAQVVDGLDDATDLIVGISEIGAVHIGLPDEEFLLIPTEGVPLWQLFRPWCEFGVLGHDAQALLVGEDGVAHFVPPWSKRCISLIFLNHTGEGCCGACVAPGR